jgi:hypothetical protein
MLMLRYGRVLSVVSSAVEVCAGAISSPSASMARIGAATLHDNPKNSVSSADSAAHIKMYSTSLRVIAAPRLWSGPFSPLAFGQFPTERGKLVAY